MIEKAADELAKHWFKLFLSEKYENFTISDAQCILLKAKIMTHDMLEKEKKNQDPSVR